jgi:hypothetical protein
VRYFHTENRRRPLVFRRVRSILILNGREIFQKKRVGSVVIASLGDETLFRRLKPDATGKALTAGQIGKVLEMQAMPAASEASAMTML